MRKGRKRAIPTLNSVIISTLTAVTLIIVLTVVLLLDFLLGWSKDSAVHVDISEAGSIALFIIIAGFICVAATALIIIIGANSLVKPVKDLSRRAQQVASGNFDADIFYLSDSDARSRSEIALLRMAFNEMLNALQENIRTVEKRVDERTADLKKLSSYIRLLVDHATNMFVLFDCELNMLYCSNSVLDLLGLDLGGYDEIINKPLSITHSILPDRGYAERSAARFGRILGGEKELIADDIINWPGKGARSFHITYRRMYDEEGSFDGVVLTLLDVTDIRREEAQHRVDDMLGSSRIACFVWNESGRFVAYNKESAKTFIIDDSLSADEFNDKFFAIQPDYQPDGKLTEDVRHDLIRESLEKGFAQMNGMLQKSDGTPIYVNVTVARIAWLEGYRLIVYIHDVTRVRVAEIQKEAAVASNKAKSAFLANMSHEIRTPMNSIMGFSELAMEEVISPKAKEHLGRIMENSKWLLQIIDDILDLSKIESGNMELEIIPFDLHELLSSCKNSIMPKAIEKNIILSFYADKAEGKTLLGDPTKLRQVLLNLLSNAVKFTESGRISLTSSISKLNDDEVTLRFEVTDTGIGMTPAQIAIVLEPFMQADVSTTRKYGGTGLGLAISSDILKLMGSELEIESEIGVGTAASFEVTISVSDEALEDHILGGDADEQERPMFSGRVLICEDNKMNQSVLVEHLERVGLHADIAENGMEGVEKVRQRIEYGARPYDLIFMDIHMPVMDGIAATPQIIELGSGTPIVAMTANVMTEDRELYKQVGMDDYVGKPFTSQELWKCLLRFLEPVAYASDDYDRDALIDMMRTEFVRSNADAAARLDSALEAGDTKTAHRIAHSVKGNAGQIGMAALQQAAASLEDALEDAMENGGAPPDGLADLLKSELSKALGELEPRHGSRPPEGEPGAHDAESILRLLEELEPLLDRGSPSCLAFAPRLRGVPGAEKLVDQIEDFYFGDAAKTLLKMKEKYDDGRKE